MRGRKPKPHYLRVLDGNAGHRPIPNTPQPKYSLRDPPDNLHERQKEIWRDALAAAPAGLLSSLDWSVFAAWVAAVHTFEEARSWVASKGSIVKTRDGNWMQNPWMSIQNKQAMLIRAHASELGFSPTARMRVSVDKGGHDANPFDDLKAIDDE